MSDSRLYAAATERNREPILTVLKRVLPSKGTVLEVASGTGEHAVFWAPRLSFLQWLPSEPQPESLESVRAWRKVLPAPNLLEPVALNVGVSPWPVETSPPASPITAIVNINMVHISAWAMCEALMAGAGRVLSAGGVLYLYGPFIREGVKTAPSNEAFDVMLRDRNSDWGIRALADVIAIAQIHGLEHTETIEMPANNLSVVFRRK